MIDDNNNTKLKIDECFKKLSGSEKKFVLKYIESSFDKIEAIKATLKHNKEYNTSYYRIKAHTFLNRESIKSFLSIYFDNLKTEHDAKVTKLLCFLENKVYAPETEDTNNNLKYKSLEILSKYLLDLDNKKSASVSVTDTSGQTIQIEYV